jgi:8-oxo-dGTP diphosphatase
MKCSVYDYGKLQHYKYVVVFARYNDKWILCKHKNRNTWETSGGHIEPGETPLEAAKRELFEETGSIDFNIIPLCDYWACDEPHETKNITWANGQIFLAYVNEIGKMPESEMERIDLFDVVPKNLTYPDIMHELLPLVKNEIEKNNSLGKIVSYNKLVRDNIIKIIKDSGKDCTYDVLSNNEYAKELNKKLLEEVNEFIETGDIEELADIIEVINYILENKGIKTDEVEEIRKRKKGEKGGFESRIYLKNVIEQNC